MKILLISLPREGEALDYTTRDYLLTDFSKYPPLGLMAIASGISADHSVELFDASIKAPTIAETIAGIVKARPDLLGISVVTRRLWALTEITRIVRQKLPQCTIVVGGPHINYWPSETLHLGNIDYALPGSCEFSFPELIEAVSESSQEKLAQISSLHYFAEGKLVINPDFSRYSLILDHIPFPRRNLVSTNDYFTAVDMASMTTTYSSRGCPFSCIFCDVQDKSFSFRSGNNIADEFESLIEQGVEEIHIFDDVFNVRKDRVMELCSEIKKRGIKPRWSIRARVTPWDREMLQAIRDAGCTRIHVGVESLDEETLLYMNKHQTLADIHSFFQICNELGLDTLAYLIIGFPTETEAYRNTFYERLLALNPTYAFVNILFPLPRTKYYEDLIKNGTYQRDYWADYLMNPTPNFVLPLPRSPELQKHLEEIADRFHRKFCFRMRFLWREFRRSIVQPSVLLLKIRLAFILLRETVSWRR